MDALSRLLVDLRAQQVLARVDPEATDRTRGALDGAVCVLEVLGRHGLTLSDCDAVGVWSAAMIGSMP